MTNLTENTEKRKSPRLNVNFQTTIRTPYLGERIATCKNISKGGAFLEISFGTFEQPDVSFTFLKYEEIHLKIKLEDIETEIEAIGVLKWGKEIYSQLQRSGKTYGIGIEFLNLLSKRSKKLDLFISEKINRINNIPPTKELSLIAKSSFERRICPRRKVSIPLTYKYNGQPYRAYTKDISKSGIFLITDESLNVGENIIFDITLPNINFPLRINGKVVRINKFSYRDNICLPTGLGICFEAISETQARQIQGFIDAQKTPPCPELNIYFEPRFCYLYSIDLSIGCKNECIYCHFSDLTKETYIHKYNSYPVPVDITPLYTIKDFPSTIFLSPSSDPFTDTNQDLAHEVLSYLLPKGIIFIILTKEIIPEKTLELIKKYKDQFEGIAIGITNLDLQRNKIIEPKCPTAEQRIECLKKLVKTGVKNARLRMDPMFPTIDDTEDNFKSMVEVASKIGVKNITGTYIFTFGKFLKRLKEEPYLSESMKFINEKSPMQGGNALTVPLKMKEYKYMRLHEICKSKNIHFNTCGCKENRLRDLGFPLTCRNPEFYNKQE